MLPVPSLSRVPPLLPVALLTVASLGGVGVLRGVRGGVLGELLVLVEVVGESRVASAHNLFQEARNVFVRPMCQC